MSHQGIVWQTDSREGLRSRRRRFLLSGLKQVGVALGETLRQALGTLRAHKLRSLLTLIGVILAVMTLVAVMSLIGGGTCGTTLQTISGFSARLRS